MTLNDLIERLENYREDLGGETEVRLMTQQNWPFENKIYGLCSSDEIQEADEDPDEEPEDEIIYIVEGNQLGYGNSTAWEAAE